MGAVLDKIFGHLLLVVLCEVLFLVLLLQADGPWHEQRYGVLAGLGLGTLGAPLTLLVPYLLAQDNGFAAVVMLVAAPAVNLFLRGAGIHLRADQAKSPLEP